MIKFNIGKESIKSIVIFDVLLIYWKVFIYISIVFVKHRNKCAIVFQRLQIVL